MKQWSLHIYSAVLAAALAFGQPAALAFGETGPQPGPLPPASSASAVASGEGAAETVASGEGTAPAEASAEGAPASEEGSTVDPTQAPRYLLPNLGQATPAKLQTPWGACWAFAVAGALESSILKAEAVAAGAAQDALPPDSPAFSELNLTNLPAIPDISERAIAWFAHESQTEASAGAQAGEGFPLIESAATEQLSSGNFATAASALTAWQTLLTEEAAPYAYNGFEAGSSQPWYQLDGGFDARQENWSLYDETRITEDTGWRVSEVLRLQSPARVSAASDGSGTVYEGYDPAGTAAIKRTLANVGGVAIALQMEQSIPQDVVKGEYQDVEAGDDITFATWSQYCATDAPVQNHAALILGWDDTYPASAFQGASSGQPPADGAWLCKNSWGNDDLFSSLGGEQDATHWGLRDGNGQSSGYFWLSYYDHSISDPEAFAVTPVSQSYDAIYQHDYVGAAEFVTPSRYSGEVRCANVFQAEATQLVKAVGAWTFDANGSFDVKVSMLPVGFNAEGKDATQVMEAATAVASVTGSFADAGYHTVALDTPVLVMAGQSFAVTVVIHAAPEEGEENAEAGEGQADTYLGLEVAFAVAAHDNQTTQGQVIANEGETFVSTNGQAWQSLEEYSQRLVSQYQQTGRTMDYTYGNALVKGFADDTSMGKEDRIYETVVLQPVVP